MKQQGARQGLLERGAFDSVGRGGTVLLARGRAGGGGSTLKRERPSDAKELGAGLVLWGWGSAGLSLEAEGPCRYTGGGWSV